MKNRGTIGVALSVAAALTNGVLAQEFDRVISTPGGSFTISLAHRGPTGSLVAPSPPRETVFRPPSIFSAPLPSGSGARALGFSGAFTAVADDATAASWNPAGLVQLERPEASLVYRYSRQNLEHRSGEQEFRVGDNAFDAANLNYLSLSYPFHLTPIGRNAVVSFNYQEAYDFTHKFTADVSAASTASDRGRDRETFTGSKVDHKTSVTQSGSTTIIADIDVMSSLSTKTESSFDQVLNSGLVSDVDFDQEGIIYALTPAFALEVTPSLSLGVALNYYRDGGDVGLDIRSRTRAAYSGSTRSRVNTDTARTTSGDYTYDLTVVRERPGFTTRTNRFVGSGTYAPERSYERDRDADEVHVDGFLEEVNEFDDLHGYNATLGVLWDLSDRLTVGAAVDLPWTAEGEQTRRVRNEVTTYNAARSRVLDRSVTDETVTKDVEFEFPLYWAAGFLWRWTPFLFTTMDVSQTRWSDFSFKAEGEPRINPLDGSPHDENPLDDTWAVRAGTEYFLRFPKTEVPLRAGLAWEQRPAPGEPDDYFSASVGGGISLGKEPRKTIIDCAYTITVGDGVSSVVPERPDLESDSVEHQIFLSVIQHL